MTEALIRLEKHIIWAKTMGFPIDCILCTDRNNSELFLEFMGYPVEYIDAYTNIRDELYPYSLSIKGEYAMLQYALCYAFKDRDDAIRQGIIEDELEHLRDADKKEESIYDKYNKK